MISKVRKPGLTGYRLLRNRAVPVTQVGKDLFRDLKRVAQTLDGINGGEAYQEVCDELVACFDGYDLTFSARILRL